MTKGLENPDMLLTTLGIFSLIFPVSILIAIAYMFHRLILRGTKFEQKWCLKISRLIMFNFWLRYLNTGYLKLAHQSIFFVFFSHKLEEVLSSGAIILNFIYLLIVTVWPVFIYTFLRANESLLKYRPFKKRFRELYYKLKVRRPSQYLYFMYYCLNRYALVLVTAALSEYPLLLANGLLMV
jgi:hypothetical protein